jgi:hypothetical protein
MRELFRFERLKTNKLTGPLPLAISAAAALLLHGRRAPLTVRSALRDVVKYLTEPRLTEYHRFALCLPAGGK